VNRVLVVDDHAELIDDLQRAGFEIDSRDFEAIVVRVGDDGLPPTSHAVPVVAVIEDGDPEERLRAAIAGAVKCVTPDEIVDALRAVLAADAPSLVEQQRRARVVALEAIARSGDEPGCRVRLTRLERRPTRPSAVPAASPLAGCTAKQRELLDAITRAGGVSDAAIALGTNRGTIYATLRRIAHRVNLRDSGELLRIIGAQDPAGRQ